MKKVPIIISSLLVLGSACNKKLELRPTNGLTSDVVYSTPAGYKNALAKVYAAFALTGNVGPNGNGDVQGIDEGTADFLRLYWKAQELTTDEAVVAWGDPGIQDWHNMNWDANNPLIGGIYNRAYYEIGICNEFIRESTDDKLSSRLTGADVDQAKAFRAEARFLRAVSYMHVIDLFGG